MIAVATELDIDKIKEILSSPNFPLNRIIFVEEEIDKLIEKKKKIGTSYTIYKGHLDRTVVSAEQLRIRLADLEIKLHEVRNQRLHMLMQLYPLRSDPGESAIEIYQLSQALELKSRGLGQEIREARNALHDAEVRIKSTELDIIRLRQGANTATADAIILEKIRQLIHQFDRKK